MSITDQEVLELLKNNQYLDAVKLYETKYGVKMKEALAVIRPLWRELRKERSAARAAQRTEESGAGRYDRKEKVPVQKEVPVVEEETTLEDLQEMAEDVLEGIEFDPAEEQEIVEVEETPEVEDEAIEPPPAPESQNTSNSDQLIRELMEQGNMEGAAKVYEEAYGVSITEAINQVFQMRKGMVKNEPEPEPEAPVIEPDGDYASGQTYAISPEIIELVKAGKKIEAVKRFREIYNTSLKDSKHFVDEIAGRL